MFKLNLGWTGWLAVATAIAFAVCVGVMTNWLMGVGTLVMFCTGFSVGNLNGVLHMRDSIKETIEDHANQVLQSTRFKLAEDTQRLLAEHGLDVSLGDINFTVECVDDDE